MKLENYIDHTLLKPTATNTQIGKLCEEAKRHQFYAVCVNGCHVALAKRALEGTDIKLAAVVGFPLGAASSRTKIFEATDCIDNGADEIDMVLNMGWLKSGEIDAVMNEIAAVKKAIGLKVLKVILETCYLSPAEIVLACEAAVLAKADFVKTSTGFGTRGASFEDVTLMKKIVGDRMKIKASGGIKDAETARKYLEMGASRIGTSSGVVMVRS